MIHHIEQVTERVSGGPRDWRLGSMDTPEGMASDPAWIVRLWTFHYSAASELATSGYPNIEECREGVLT